MRVPKTASCTGDQYKDLDVCPVCQSSRYKHGSTKSTSDRNKRDPTKVAWLICEPEDNKTNVVAC